MSQIHYFQRYSQPENHATNNTLLLLRRIQAHDPRLLTNVLNELLVETGTGKAAILVGAQFSQQTRGKGSVPDGVIFQDSFRVILETKMHVGFSTSQLRSHLESFRQESRKILLLLSPERWQGTLAGAEDLGVNVISRTFADVINACDEAGLREDVELRELVDDYEAFCYEMNLISGKAERMLVVTAGFTIRDNIDLRVYYAPTERSHQSSSYLGLYTDKAVRAIGLISKIVPANLVGGEVQVADRKDLSEEEMERIKKAIERAPVGWDIQTGHAFFLVDNFVRTRFVKASRGGLLGKRYFDLRHELGLDHGESLPSVEQICELLKAREWS